MLLKVSLLNDGIKLMVPVKRPEFTLTNALEYWKLRAKVQELLPELEFEIDFEDDGK